MLPFTKHNTTTQPKKKRTLDWRPRTAEELSRRKNRRVISQHLKRIGKIAGRELSLDHNGVCCFTFRKFVVCVEVPEDNSSICLFYSKVCHLGVFDNHQEVQRFVDIYNHRQATSSQEMTDLSTGSESTCPALDPHAVGTRLAVKDDEEVNLCFSFPIQGLSSYEDTAAKLESYVKKAVSANFSLERAKSTPLLLPEPATKLPEDAPPSPGGSSVTRRMRFWSTDSQTSVSNMSQCGIFSLFSSSNNHCQSESHP